MNSRNTNIIPITRTRSAKRGLTRYLADKLSKSVSEAEIALQGAALCPDSGKGRDILALLRQDANVNVPGVKPGYLVDPAPNGGRYPDSFTAIVRPVPPVFPEDTNMMIEIIRISLSESSQLSATLFTNCTLPISREQFLRPSGIVDDGQGAVYAFFNEQKAVHVGITGSRVKLLLKTPTPTLVDAPWWPTWTHMRFLPLKSASDRVILENLLILSLAPIANQQPGAAVVEQFLTEMEGD